MAIAIAILSSALPYSLEMKAMRKHSRKNIRNSYEHGARHPDTMGLLILKETLSEVQWIAIACIVAASAGSASTAKVHPCRCVKSPHTKKGIVSLIKRSSFLGCSVL